MSKRWSHSGKTAADPLSDDCVQFRLNFSKMNFLKWCRDNSSSLVSAATLTSHLRVLKRGTANVYTGNVPVVRATNNERDIFQKDTKL